MKEDNTSSDMFKSVGAEFQVYGVEVQNHVIDLLELFGRNERYWRMKMDDFMLEIESNKEVIEDKIERMNKLRLFVLGRDGN